MPSSVGRRGPPDAGATTGGTAIQQPPNKPPPSSLSPPTECSGEQQRTVINAYEQAAKQLANALNRLDAFLANPKAPANKCVAAALKENFGIFGTPSPTTPATPQMVRDNIQKLMNGLGRNHPVSSKCGPGERESPLERLARCGTKQLCRVADGALRFLAAWRKNFDGH